ncbi:MAG: cytochrome c [Phenylobacterium sp.]|uniref:c-type cytochrome n=1 Tax=Phenylobacterium sp. TaxID=1871053 RepID=UPI00271C9B90|nr:cytochrome c [Phenylobacterium sp.]MDO9430171.1 cytochrome c [Phenylobacterium sp.]
MSERHAKTSRAAIALVLALTATGALAASAAETAIATRQAGYKKMGGAFKAINEELKKASPDMKLIAANSAVVNTQAQQIPKWFPKGSGSEAGFKTKAKPAIWTEPAKFAAAGGALQAEAGKLQTFAAAGNLDAVKTQVRAVGGTCKSCHDAYRAED